MSHSLRHQEKRRERAEQKLKDNRIKRNALRNKHRLVSREPISLAVIKEERKRRRSLWQKAKDFYNEKIRGNLQRRQR